MINSLCFPYGEVYTPDTLAQTLELNDHLCGFDQNFHNKVLYLLNSHAVTKGFQYDIKYHQILESKIRKLYPNLEIRFDKNFSYKSTFCHFINYRQHPELTFQNFLCSFNGTPHVSRKLLVTALEKFQWFDPDYSSKNFVLDRDMIAGHVADYVSGDQEVFYNKFFNVSDKFYQTIYSFGHERYDHAKNIYNLETKLTQSFLHIVSESMATSYCPYVTEKFLYSVLTRGLFLSYAQPGWHDHLEQYYGFKKYTKLFDYQFDLIQNPIDRLIALMSMISKFSILSSDEWRDLYQLEQDTIEYNYDHYFSGSYLKQLENST